jgi:hypothetical protein
MSERERFVDYMLWVKRQPCLLVGERGAGPCDGGIEADHAGVLAAADVEPSDDLGPVDGRGTSRKPDDRTCIPLCRRHHEDRHQARGFFAVLSKEARRLWRLAAIARTQARWRTYQLNMSAGWF